MRTSILALALALSPVAVAQDVCLGATCVEDALRTAFATEGLDDVDGLALSVDAKGAHRVTITSNDLDGLALLAAPTRSAVLPIRGTDAWVVTLPIDLSGLDVLSIDGGGTTQIGLLVPAVQGSHEGGGGGGGGGGECVEVCVCTEDGPECWLEC